jgi:hypothetical protein
MKRSNSVEAGEAMRDVTRNLFYWFRGGSDDEQASRRQLENNLTKSLVTVLEHCDRKAVLDPILKTLGLRPSADVVFALQRRPALAGAARKRIVLGITGGDTELAQTSPRVDAGRPDAWICGHGWTVLVEGKVGRKIQTGQMVAHAQAVGWRPGAYRIVCITWQALHRLCKRAKDRIPARDQVSHLLLGDWLSYLEHQNMTEFEKLEPMDFDFPNLPEEERRALLRRVKVRVRVFAQKLAKRAPVRRIARLYEQHQADQWKFGEPSATSGRGLWFNIGGEPSPRKWHATVFYQPHGLAVTVLNSGNHLAQRLCNAGVDVFRDIVEMAAKAKGVLVGCRRAWYSDPKSPYKGQHIVRAEEPVLVEAHALDAGSRDAFAVMLKNTMERLLEGKRWRTELHVRQDVSADQLLYRPLKRQIELTARAAHNLDPILQRLLQL